MASQSITVRALATPTERELHFQFADAAFSRDPSPQSMRHWQQFVTTMPGYRPEQLRGAFRYGEQVGSYIFHECASPLRPYLDPVIGLVLRNTPL